MVVEEAVMAGIQTYGFSAVSIYLILRLENTVKENTAAIFGLKEAIATCPKKRK